MKAIVSNIPTTRWGIDEHHVLGVLDEDYDIYKIHSLLTGYFMDILFAIQISNDKESLKCNIKFTFENSIISKYYTYGFGDDHVWVKQIDVEGNAQGGIIILASF